MKLYEFVTTEHNGEQEYSHYHLVYADTLADATKMAREFCSQWYEVEDPEDVVHNVGERTGDKLNEYWEFLGGNIILDLDSVTETNANTFEQEAFRRSLISGMPKEGVI